MGISQVPAVTAAAGRKSQTFTSSGTFTAPTSSTYNGWVNVLCIGGGSGGGYSSSGRGGGFGAVISEKLVQVAAGGSVTVTVGSGGAGGTSGSTSGTAGGTSSFGALVSAAGGIQTGGSTKYGDFNGVTPNGGAAPGMLAYLGTSTLYTIPGQSGLYGYAGGGGCASQPSGSVNPDSSRGGAGGLGGGKGGSGSAGQAGITYGSGGGEGGQYYSGSFTNYNGGAGADGAVIVTWFE